MTILPGEPMQALLQYDQPGSAAALLNADGLTLGGRSIKTSRFAEAPQAKIPIPTQIARRPAFDPFGQALPLNLTTIMSTPSSRSNLNPVIQPFSPHSRLRTTNTSDSGPVFRTDSNSDGGKSGGTASTSASSHKSNKQDFDKVDLKTLIGLSTPSPGQIQQPLIDRWNAVVRVSATVTLME